MNPNVVFLVGLVLALLGWLIVPRITNTLAMGRDRDNRKRSFRAVISATRDGLDTTADDKLVEAHQVSVQRIREECAVILDDVSGRNRAGFQKTRDTYLSLTGDDIKSRDPSKKAWLRVGPERYEIGRARLRQLLDELIGYMD